jgi:hypothetical protein
MNSFVDLSIVKLETQSSLWQLEQFDGETVLQLANNKIEDHIGGKVALLPVVKQNYRMVAEMRFLRHHLEEGEGGWFGFVMRAQDLDNYELVWFMPNAEGSKTVAYVPVAHGVVPWWTEAYAKQERGSVHIPIDAWFQARVDVVGDEFSLYVDDKKVFTKKMTYYLSEGQPGFYVGTATDAAFRRVLIEDLV